jgi:hypothetical protein
VLLKEERKILHLLNEYVSGSISREKFVAKYGRLLPRLKEKLEDGLYHPLHVIVPTEDNSERAWKESMRNMYLQEIANLDQMLEDDEPSYVEKLTEEDQKSLCKEAIEFIPKAALERSTIEWIQGNLILNEEFVFNEDNGNPRFEVVEQLYTAGLKRMSFIMTAFSGDLPKLKFKYFDLIETLKRKTEANTIWVRCSEPDGLTAVDGTPWYSNPADEIENLTWLEYTDPQETQWGVCHLLFMPSHREWLLLHSNDFNNFSINLYGRVDFIRSVLGEIDCA